MTLVLLPGMDGTGLLFAALLAELNEIETLVLALPQTGPQDYATLAEYIRPQLPQADFILLAESFAGGIAAQLSQQECAHLQGVIFVAAFLSAPKKRLTQLACWFRAGAYFA